MCCCCYEEDRPDDDWDDEKIEYFLQRWLLEKEMAEYAEEHAPVAAPKAALEASHANPEVW